MKSFTINPYDNYDVYFVLNICGSRKEMLKQIKDHLIKRDGIGSEICSNAAGMFCPTCQKIDTDIPGMFWNNIFGTMFLNLEDLTLEIIIHESAHAAFSWEHRVRRYTGNFDLDCDDEQERYCYFIGKISVLVREIIRKNFKGVRV